jgi:hypothetical protein
MRKIIGVALTTVAMAASPPCALGGLSAEFATRSIQKIPGVIVASADFGPSNEPTINTQCSRYFMVIEKEAEWARRFGENHLAVVNVRNQARDICSSILETLKQNNVELGEPTTRCSAVCSLAPTR